MALMYDRKETRAKVVIVYKYQALFYYVLAAVLVVSVVNQFLGWILLPLFTIYGLVHVLGKMEPGKEIRRAMLKGKVRISGNRFSFKNPLTFEIDKN